MIGTLRWFNPAIRAFALSETRVAYDFLGLTSDEQERITAIRAELESELDEPHPLEGAAGGAIDAHR